MNNNDKDDYGVIIETKKYDKNRTILIFTLIITIAIIIFCAIAINSTSNNITLSNQQENISENVIATTSDEATQENSSANTAQAITTDETSNQNTVKTEYTPTEYKEYALNKVEELYDKDCFKYAGYYQHYSGNEFRLQFLFNNTMSEDEYKSKIKENTEKIYSELKDKYIKKEHIADSKDISIHFVYYISDKKSVSGKRGIWSYSIHYIDFLDNGNWPSIESDYTLNLE